MYANFNYIVLRLAGAQPTGFDSDRALVSQCTKSQYRFFFRWRHDSTHMFSTCNKLKNNFYILTTTGFYSYFLKTMLDSQSVSFVSDFFISSVETHVFNRFSSFSILYASCCLCPAFEMQLQHVVDRPIVTVVCYKCIFFLHLNWVSFLLLCNLKSS